MQRVVTNVSSQGSQNHKEFTKNFVGFESMSLALLCGHITTFKAYVTTLRSKPKPKHLKSNGL